MPVEIIGGYPCPRCGGTAIEEEEDNTFYWVEQGLLLVETVTEYKCSWCSSILIRITKHREEKFG